MGCWDWNLSRLYRLPHCTSGPSSIPLSLESEREFSARTSSKNLLLESFIQVQRRVECMVSTLGVG